MLLLFYSVLGFVITFIGYFVAHPIALFVRNIIILVYTLVHEFAHAVLALLTSGEVHEMNLHFDTSGFVIASPDSEEGGLITTFGGYTLPCIISIACYILLDLQYASFVLVLFVAMAALSFVFIRNWYGFFWLTGFIMLLVAVYMKTTPVIIEHVAMFLTGILFAGSVYGGWRICVMSFMSPDDAGDATSLAERTFIPAQIWGIIFLFVSLATLVIVPAYFFGLKEIIMEYIGIIV